MNEDAKNTTNGATQAISLDSRTLRLLELLSEKSQDLADMLKGSWTTLNSTDNPDMLPQVCHSMRELIEKAPLRIPEVPIEKDDPSTRKVQIIALIKTFNGSSQTPAQLLTTQLNILWPLRDFFMAVAHHNKPETTINEVKEAIINLEECLLNLINPEPIPDLEELDMLIAEGDAI
ncbi:MAG TPA: hypothetical protein VGE34_00880 [Candidatus Saccharimonadales bacterium]